MEEELKSRSERMASLERRIAEQQIESGNKTAKLADMQRLQLVSTLVNECIFEGETPESMEYEDMRLILRERLGHLSCKEDAAKLQAKVGRTARVPRFKVVAALLIAPEAR